MSQKLILLVCAFLAAVARSADASKVIPIKALDLAFDSEFVEANPGDVLEFHFLPHNHSVVMGDFDRPCKAAKSGGFYSGFFALMSGEADQVFRVTVNDSKPFVFYCSQDVPGHQHCQAGMVGVINSDNSTLSKYKEAAQTADSADSPATAFGGTFMASSPSSSTSSAATTTSAASTTPASEAAGPTATNVAERIVGGGAVPQAALAALGGFAFAAMMV